MLQIHIPCRSAAIVLLALAPGWGQTRVADASDLSRGRAIYAERCAGCHGNDAHGTGHAPQLAGNRRLRGRSLEQLGQTIQDGVPSAGMPAFRLPAADLASIALFVAALSSSASEIPLRGSIAAGERFFFGQGQCASCHMVNGRGSAIGPDLSNAGQENTVEQIRTALLQPGARVTPGYSLVTVELRDGQTIRGFSRSQTNFELELQDLHGALRRIPADRIKEVRQETQSYMPAVKATPEELNDLVAYLGRLTGAAPGPRPQAAAPNTSDFSQILNPKAGDWPTYNGKVGGNRYSELAAIDRANASRLALKWAFPVGHFGLEVTPLVMDGIMYLSGPNQAFALDAATGIPIWHYTRPRTPGLVGDASLGTNKGVALLGDKVFMVTDNAHLIALNRVTGKLVWEVTMPEEPQHYGSTVAPLVVKNLVIAGVSGGDWGIRGFLSAYKAETGEPAWRFWTVPRKGEPAAETWGPKEPTLGGGSTWLTGSYDAETDTVYWGTGNSYPDYDDRDRPGDNLYTDSIVALDPATGKLKWYYQCTPHDLHVWDATEPIVVANTRYRGQERKLLLHADRNGFFYVLDRTSGKLLLGQKFVRRLNWASGIGPDGRPQLLPANSPPPEGGMVCPYAEPTNWGSTAFNPVTRLYYLMVLEQCRFVGPRHAGATGPQPDPPQKFLRALDIETGEIAWEVPQIGTTESKHWSGVLATAGGLLFYGDPGGDFIAADERNGAPLWHLPTNDVIKASPMTYTAGGRQFVAVAVGAGIMAFGLP